MRRAWIAVLGMVLGLAGPGLAADLTKTDRTPPKLPALHSEHPEYCLLVFGPDLHKRVWLVHDGNLLYVDRNGNGDLTETDECVTAEENSDPAENRYWFKAGDIPDGQRTHKDLHVNWFKLNHLIDEDPRVKALVATNPKWSGCTVYLDVEMPGQHGGGIDGRVTQEASWQDANGLFQFGPRPEEAPVVHFDGPWQITFYSVDNWHVGQTAKPYLAMGTPGLGAGSTAFVPYQGIIPPELKPTLKVSYPPAVAGQPLVEKSYELDHRCCGINLYGNITVPAEVGTGEAQVAVSLASWPGASVASSEHIIKIVPPKTRPKLEPVSPRLKGSLAHSQQGSRRDDSIVEIQFSPDGNRLVAGNYPGGVVNMWDVATGKRLLEVATGEEYRVGYQYFVMSPDWKIIYAPTCRKDRKNEKITQAGKTLFRWTFNDSVRIFDAATGNLLRTLQHSPPRDIANIDLTADGQYLLTNDGVPGDYVGRCRRCPSLWDVQTGTHREVVDDYHGLTALSPDGKQLAVPIPSNTDKNFDQSIKILNLPDLSERATIQLPGFATARPCEFCMDGSLLAARIEVHENSNDWQNSAASLRVYEIATGKEILCVDASEKGASFYPVLRSLDGRTLVATDRKLKRNQSSLCFIDLNSHNVDELQMSGELFANAISHDGKWLATSTIQFPKELLADAEAPAEELPQPRIHIVDLASHQIVETLIAPQSNIVSLAFSPDGNTLATSGPGEVLLWDFSTSPGEPRP